MVVVQQHGPVGPPHAGGRGAELAIDHVRALLGPSVHVGARVYRIGQDAIHVVRRGIFPFDRTVPRAVGRDLNLRGPQPEHHLAGAAELEEFREEQRDQLLHPAIWGLLECAGVAHAISRRHTTSALGKTDPLPLTRSGPRDDHECGGDW